MGERRTPTSTYRLQLSADFGFRDAARIVRYLSRLGVSHLYLSPILQAAPGSIHGYDVVDHSVVSADLGGEDGLVELAAAAHEHGLGLVVDVVPNHMAVPAPEHLNRQLWETLRHGREAATAHWFDVEWDLLDGKLALPILGAPLQETLARGELTLDRDGDDQVLCYADHRFPLAPGSDPSDLKTLVAQQHYLLAGWREKSGLLNYRRFFDVDTLIAVRVELDDVFEATHAVLIDLHRRGVVDGFRVDHPDGLADPQAYLERLRDSTGGAFVVVEKILGTDEELPSSWPCAGTTGYDAIRAVDGALVPAVAADADELWRAAGGEPSLAVAEVDAKRLVLAELLQPELHRLVRGAVAAAAARGELLDEADAAAALTELLVHVDVYRAYLRPGLPAAAEALDRLAHVRRLAEESRPDLVEPLEVVHTLLSDTAAADPAGRDLVVRFQQVCGPVMAKGVEDTTFYRWHRMVALNEVGGDPLALDRADTGELHAWARQQAAAHPLGMTSLSTHDTKRNEDVRARLLAAAEDSAGWRACWEAVRKEARVCIVDEPTAYLVMQTLLGAWPIAPARLDDYLRKAVREAKQHTTWNDPDEDYEARVLELGRRCRVGAAGRTVAGVAAAGSPTARATTLAAKLLQLTLPGVPDVYQGMELAIPALVDPDNRGPVDYAARESLLSRLDDGGYQEGALRDAGVAKLWVTSRVLRLRRDSPGLFGPDATYQALSSTSPHLLGFLRSGRAATLVTRWPRRVQSDGWGDARVVLPAGTWRDLLTDAVHTAGEDGLRCADLLAREPVALLLLAGR
ncbi:MAG: malto-oligosyltrehalose synthase [Nocardioidaceae bacterium]